MSLEKTEIEKIAWLARLALDEDDIPGYARDLSNILGLVEQMNTIKTNDIEPLAHPMEIKARLRPDEVTETDQREKFQNIAPHVDNGHYLVPRVIE
ncbi:MAG: Asp-tRNA(Asn)/Glu-tRNA(Gln) amidotransferase subunit GatC [Proteobacteria bacterium]|nr:Asp-tRNA(Asn)/Glu-tRNA(Gln) amidotransferase subunit GatC [Pseudomonadota bacterium]MCZ6527086.1 Asp-tRNA(Asn)/Glu-tRNA(Gln) amidotransferase subunit GatC [Gammaproteobacteria bacterium]